jgi:antitoxin ParD1/3/4
VRDSLRLLEEQDALRQARLEALRAEVDLGANSGPSIPAEQPFENARKRIADLSAGVAED